MYNNNKYVQDNAKTKNVGECWIKKKISVLVL